MRWIATCAVALTAAALAACGASSQEPAADREMDPRAPAALAAGCSPRSVAALFGGFLAAVAERQQGAALQRLARGPDLIEVALYQGSRPGAGRTDSKTSEAVVQSFAATIPARAPTALLVVAVGRVAPFSDRYEERTGPGRRTAGAEIVARIGRSRALSGKIGIDCDEGRIYVGAMNVTNGLRPQKQCGRYVRLDARRSLLCVI